MWQSSAPQTANLAPQTVKQAVSEFRVTLNPKRVQRLGLPGGLMARSIVPLAHGLWQKGRESMLKDVAIHQARTRRTLSPS